ncbi:HPP family protein [Methylocystis parvus]|uniref:HPP family protein n=1 Tax=Methylocystis parvus TaxID=134 RepID=A0A6B8M258_9HYPH|nr:HPP family protein [Methylocystis parvus]QGM96372.1 HPP family protein [Methylocystis parvus]WBJ99787.1 HPP family protein [Methylocystis parvus OBBP]
MSRRIARAAAPALLSALVMGLVGLLAVLVRQPWLFPSLGPTIFLLATSPADPAARPWNVFLGHAIGVAAGFGALFLFGAQETPSVFAADAVSMSRAAATALAVGATMLLQTLSDAKHPPAAATTMLITLGGMPASWLTAAAVAVGVALVMALGYALPCAARHLRKKSGLPKEPANLKAIRALISANRIR